MTFRSLIVRLYFLNGAFACAYIATAFFTVPSYLLNLIFNMDGEGTLCSWYSSAMLLFSALCWALQLEVIRRPVERYLAAVAALSLTVLSIDESVSVHERVSTKLQNATQSPFELTGPVFLAAIPVLILGIAVWRLWPWPRRPAALLFGGATLMVGSACGFEMLANSFVYDSPMYKLEVLLEETGEMMGMTTILLGSYDHLKQRFARPVEID